MPKLNKLIISYHIIYPKELNLNKHISNSSKGCILKVDLEYSKELRKLHNNYPLAADRIEIKREIN